MPDIRLEAPSDHASVHRINELAFGTPGEADLVDALRESGPYISLVAEHEGTVVGHIFFSPVTIEGRAPAAGAMGLGPMSVLPEEQNKGIGSALVREGLEECRRRGVGIVVVLGHPEFYPRFGFQPASRFGLRSIYQVPDEVFMAMELRDGVLGGVTGLVEYAPRFGELDHR